MAVMLETSLGEIVVDLFTDECPITTKNFLKLCKLKYYNNCLFHDVKKDFLAQTGDPTGTGKGGDSVYKFLYGDQARFFEDEIHPKLKHAKKGTVAMASGGENLNASQFYITLRGELDYLDEKHTVFGEVAEGFEVLERINEAFVDESGRPYKNLRIKHTHVLDDPFDDPPGLEAHIPDRSPDFVPEEGPNVRLEEDWVPMEETMDEEELTKTIREKEAHGRAVVLEMIGDLPEADVKPPENVLFICKLNPVTQEDDLDIIFSRFGKIVSADIIRDAKTGDSLCYGFIEFENKDSCEAAYFKMDNVLIDDRRIHVDFSQSVGKLWNRYRKIGAKDSAEAGGSSYAPGAARSKGCFNCGQEGHMAKDCPEPKGGGPNAPPKPPRVELKERGVRQMGGRSDGYDMVFDDGGGHRGRPAYDKRPAEYHREGDRKRAREDVEDGGRRGGGKIEEDRKRGGAHRHERQGGERDERERHQRDRYDDRHDRGGRSDKAERNGREEKAGDPRGREGRDRRDHRDELDAGHKEKERSYDRAHRDDGRLKEPRGQERGKDRRKEDEYTKRGREDRRGHDRRTEEDRDSRRREDHDRHRRRE